MISKTYPPVIPAEAGIHGGGENLFPPAMLLILDRIYIPAEEKILEKIFGDDFINYKQRVRRWI